MIVLEGGDMALAVMETVLETNGAGDLPPSMLRRATYVFKKSDKGEWLCTIDNSYGTDLLTPNWTLCLESSLRGYSSAATRRRTALLRVHLVPPHPKRALQQVCLSCRLTRNGLSHEAPCCHDVVSRLTLRSAARRSFADGSRL
jgi:hypothetical protein